DGVELALVCRLRQQLGDVAGEVGLNVTVTLRSATKGTRRVEIGVVVDLDERLERDAEALAIIEQTAMVERDSPWSRIEIETGNEIAFLLRAAELDITVSAAERPTAPANPSGIFEHLDRIAGLAQLVSCGHAGEPSTEHENRRSLGIAVEYQWPVII